MRKRFATSRLANAPSELPLRVPRPPSRVMMICLFGRAALAAAIAVLAASLVRFGR
jgi:hypothetical protein